MKQALVKSMILRHCQIAGTPLELVIPRSIWKLCSGQEKTLGMVKIHEIG
jgi:hypothetical protein